MATNSKSTTKTEDAKTKDTVTKDAKNTDNNITPLHIIALAFDSNADVETLKADDKLEGLEQIISDNHCDALPTPLGCALFHALRFQGTAANNIMRKAAGLEYGEAKPLSSSELDAINAGDHYAIFISFCALSIKRMAFMPKAFEYLTDFNAILLKIAANSNNLTSDNGVEPSDNDANGDASVHQTSDDSADQHKDEDNNSNASSA